MKFGLMIFFLGYTSLMAQVVPEWMYPFPPSEVLIPLKQNGQAIVEPFIIQCQYKDSLLHGPIRVLWQDSTVMAEFEMDKGQFVGEYKTYYSNGSLYEEGFLVGLMNERESNKESSEPYCHISTFFEYVTWPVTSTVTVYLTDSNDSTTEFVSSIGYSKSQKSGISNTYWPNGHIKESSCFLDGERFGYQVRYDSLGKLDLLRYIDNDRYYVIEAWEDGKKVVENGFGNITEEVYLGYGYRDKGTVFFFEDYKLCIVAVPNGNGGFVLWNNN